MDHSVGVLQFAQARASEVATLMSEINSPERSKKKAWFQNLPHHMRRRAASHNPKRVPKNLRAPNQSANAKPSSKGKKHKKLPKDLKVEYASRSTPESTWLENHIWFAKRFKMKNMWGYQLPLHSNDRKLGASHRAAANRCMIQDLSYYCCIELTGAQKDILTHLSLLTDSLTGHTFGSEMFLDGSIEGHTFLYHPKCSPYKAIGPVSFLWKPVFNDENCDYKLEIPANETRQLWIWSHPSFHDELVQVLSQIFEFEETSISDVQNSDGEKTTCSEAQDSKSGILDTHYNFKCKLNEVKNKRHFCKEKTHNHKGIKMVLRKNTLVRHRLIGPTSLLILARVLRQADVGVSDEACMERGAKRIKTENGAIPSVPLTTFWWETFYKSEHSKMAHDIKGELLESLKESQSLHYVTPGSVIGLTVRDPRIEIRTNINEENSNHPDREISYSSSNVESLLTPETADSAIWFEDIRNEVTASKLSDQEINNERSKCIGTVELGMKENRIPIIIIHQKGANGFGAGWDLIAPLGWSLEFWRAFHRKGCTPAGLRDLHFINLESGIPTFPCSFPDTNASKTFEEKTRQEAIKEYYKRPISKRPNFSTLRVPTPFFMCWKTLIRDWRKECKNSEYGSLFKGFSAEEASVCEKPYVLRQIENRQLGNICSSLKKAARMNAFDKMGQKLSEDINSLVSNLHPQVQFSTSLIGLRIHCINKGLPSPHSGIYLLSKEDLEEIKKDYSFSGPTEPLHKKRQSHKKNLERPQIDSLISVSSRKMIGYISEGGFSSVCGRGYAVGHCSFIAFMFLMKQSLEANVKPLVLIREQHCVKYRVVNIEVIDNC